MGRQQKFAQLAGNAAALAKENIKALGLQAMAWRQLTMIAMADPERARPLAQMLLFRTVPFVDGAFVEKFIAEHAADAEDCGKRAGVFSC